MKKVITAILTAAAIANCIPVFSGEIIADTITTSSYTNESGDTVYTTEDGFEYTIANDEITITKYTGNAVDLTIPDYIDGLPVTLLQSTFENNNTLESVTMPDTLKKLSRTFYNCQSLKKVELNEGLETIGVQSFDACINLNEISIPFTVKSIGLRAINWGNIKKVTIYSLNIDQFQNLNNENIIVECYKNTDLYDYCIKKGISVESLGVYMPDEEFAFKYEVNEDNTATITGHNFANVVNIEIPETIDGHVVTGLKSVKGKFIETITMPDTVTTLAPCAFYGCEKLQNIRLSKNITDMPTYITDTVYEEHTGEFAHYSYAGIFENCYALKKVIIPDSVKHLGYKTFSGCGLEKIVIPASVTRIDNDSKSTINSNAAILKYENCDLTIYTYPTYPKATAEWFAQERGIPYKYVGDLNENGSIDSEDALTILQYTVGNAELTDEQLEICDFNLDGEISSEEALKILQYTVGSIDSLY